MKPETTADIDWACQLLAKSAITAQAETNQVVGTDDHIAIIRHYDTLRDLTRRIKDARESLDRLEEHLSRQAIPDVFLRHEIKTITVEGVGRVTVSNKWGCSMIDKEAGLRWLRETGNEGLIQETVNASTLAAFAKNLSDTEGKDLPDEIFKVGRVPYTSITKVR